MANICRSPALEAVLKSMATQRGLSEQLKVDSCGISWSRLGENADPRTFAEAKKRGIYIDHKSQQFQDHFFDDYDYLFVVDEGLAEQLKLRAIRPAQRKKILLATAFSKNFQGKDIPDPYYMGIDGFKQVMDIVIDSCEGILETLFGPVTP